MYIPFIHVITNQLEYFSKITWRERWECARFFYVLSTSEMRKSTAHISPNRCFSLSDVPYFQKALWALFYFNNGFVRLLFNPKYKGIKAWEYGLCLSTLSVRKSMKILDVGSGNGLFPLYMSSLGARVHSFDLVHPMEQSRIHDKNVYDHIIFDTGTMTALPYKKNSFDCVTSISALEHLVPLSEAPKAIMEMIRVLKPGGVLFITSDLVLCNHPKRDRYRMEHTGVGITAFTAVSFFRLIKTIKEHGCTLVGKEDYDIGGVIKDRNRTNYRGEDFTTFAIYARKNA